MLDAVTRFFDRFLQPEQLGHQVSSSHGLALATAALLFEVIYADQAASEVERERVRDLLRTEFALSEEELDELAGLAEAEMQDATDLYQFTRLINQTYDEPGRIALLRNLWHVAWADGRVDHYEEHMIRRIADLLHLHHKDFIRTKLETRISTDQPTSNEDKEHSHA